MSKLVALGNRSQATKPEFIRSVLGELVLTFIFAFVSVGASITAGRLVGGPNSIMGLTAVVLANAMLVATIITAGLDLSAGQLNPAVTIGLAAGGYMTVLQGVFYVIVQLSGASMACLLLKYLVDAPDLPVHGLSAGIEPLQGVLIEVVITFIMVLFNFAIVVNPQKGYMSRPGPLFVGFIVGANNFAVAPLTGASMNPARSFGPALASWNWTNHWIYWVGPLLGSGLASLVYENIFNSTRFNIILQDEEIA